MASEGGGVKRTGSETGDGQVVSPPLACEREEARGLAAAIAEVARQLRQAGIPPPRGQEFFGLDLDMPYEIGALELLGSQGIFRKYEFALEIESGLGGRARWAAETFGCRVVGVECTPAKAIVAVELARRSQVAGVSFVCARASSLPVASGKFTHVWWLGARETGEAAAILAEAHRALRDGGYFAIVVPGAGEDLATCWRERLAAAGFERVQARAWATDVPGERWRLAARRLSEYLHGRERELQAWRSWVSRVRPIQPRSGVVLFARRRPKLRAGLGGD